MMIKKMMQEVTMSSYFAYDYFSLGYAYFSAGFFTCHHKEPLLSTFERRTPDFGW